VLAVDPRDELAPDEPEDDELEDDEFDDELWEELEEEEEPEDCDELELDEGDEGVDDGTLGDCGCGMEGMLVLDCMLVQPARTSAAPTSKPGITG